MFALAHSRNRRYEFESKRIGVPGSHDSKTTVEGVAQRARDCSCIVVTMSVTTPPRRSHPVVLNLALGAEVVANAREAGQVYTSGRLILDIHVDLDGDLFTNTKLVENLKDERGAFALEVYDFVPITSWSNRGARQ